MSKGASTHTQKTSSSARAADAAREGVEQLKDAAQQLADEGRERAQEYVDQGREMANQYLDEGRQRALDLQQSLEQQIREQPVKAILAAAGVGFILGVFFMRR